MTLSKSLLALAMTAATAGAISTPAAAVVVTFATFSATTSANNFRLVNSGNNAARTTDATVYSTATGTATTPGSAPVKFSFLIPQLAPFITDVNALYTLSGSIAKNSPVSSSGFFIQSGYSGSFSFLTTSAITISGPGFITHTYAAGSNLLSGTFSNGNIVGTIGSTSGSAFASGPSGVNITFTSDFLDFSGSALLDRATSLTAVTSPFSKHSGLNGALNGFRAVTGGQFSSDPVPIVNFTAPVPEPGSWALLVVGFGMVGATLRRRSAVAA